MLVDCCYNCRKENLKVWKKLYLRIASYKSVTAAPYAKNQSSNVDESSYNYDADDEK
jgi:hypothetical protein